MADVARLAGVSHQTVSRVINGRTNLRPETRERVLDAIRQLGYRPNSAARALVTRRSGTIGVIGSKTGFWGPSTVHREVQLAGREAGYFVSSADLGELTRSATLDAIDHLNDQSVEGIILITATDEAVEVARAQQERGVPVVVVEGDESTMPWTIGVDQVTGAELATKHLLDLGHREIVHVAGPLSWPEGRSRVRGWSNAMYAAGLQIREPYIGDWTAETGYDIGRELADRSDVTAVFCANDQMALGLLRAMHEAGRSVPADISVVGFDDIPEAAYLIPPLTTVRQDFATLGRRAISILQAAMAGLEHPPRHIEPELVVRASSAAPSNRKDHR